MAPDKLEDCAQCCVNKFDCRLFISKFIEIAFYLSLSLSVMSKSWDNFGASVAASQLALCWMCDSPRTGCAWWTTPMWREQAEINWSRRGIFIVVLYNSGKHCALAARPFQSQQNGALTRMWKWCQVQPSQKERAKDAVRCKNEGMLLESLSWCCIESVVFIWSMHENDQTWTCICI